MTQRQVIHRKLRNQSCSFTRDEECGSFPLLPAPHYLISICQTLTYLKTPLSGYNYSKLYSLRKVDIEHFSFIIALLKFSIFCVVSKQ